MSLTSDLQTALTTLMGTTQTSAAAAATAWANALGAITSWDSSSATIPLKVVCPAYLSAGDISTNFDGTGLGTTTRWIGWAICNGNNGTPNLNNVFPRWSTVAAGTTGGEDTNSHTHAAGTSGAPSNNTSDAEASHTHGMQSHTHTSATTDGHGLTVAELASHQHATYSDSSHDSFNAGVASGSGANGFGNAGSMQTGLTGSGTAHSHTVSGSTGGPSNNTTTAGSSHTHTMGNHTHSVPITPAPSDTENRPAFNSIVPVMRIS